MARKSSSDLQVYIAICRFMRSSLPIAASLRGRPAMKGMWLSVREISSPLPCPTLSDAPFFLIVCLSQGKAVFSSLLS